jgi:hypothetical protein
MNYVGWFAVLLAQHLEFLVEFLILGGPLLTVLLEQYVVFRVVDDLAVFFGRCCTGTNKKASVP